MYISPISEPESSLRTWVPDASHIYYIGSSEGCGCGWRPVHDWDDSAYAANKMKDRAALVELLRDERFGGSHLIICWEGDQGAELERREQLVVSALQSADFELEERVDYVLHGDTPRGC